MNLPSKSRRKRTLSRSILDKEHSLRLEGLLEQLAPDATIKDISSATIFAIDQIRMYQYSVHESSELDGKLRDDRKQWNKDMTEIHESLDNLRSALTKQSTAVAFLGKWWRITIYGRAQVPGADQNHELHQFAVEIGLAEIKEFVSEAMLTLSRQMENSCEPSTVAKLNADSLLACGMRLTLEQLGLKISMTRDQDLHSPRPTSANYARLLRLAIELAGGTAPVDLLPAMRQGKILVKPFVGPFG